MTVIWTKSARHSKIADILSKCEIHTQDQLRSQLLEAGIEVTRATLSRDLDELQAQKVTTVSGDVVYVIPEVGEPLGGTLGQPDADSLMRLGRVVREVMTNVTAAQNLVVVHTRAGAANYLAGSIDRQSWSNIVGSIAGDDTVLVIAPSNQAALELVDLFLSLTTDKHSKAK